MTLRPRTEFVLELKDRRCTKCGKKLNRQLKRCPVCANDKLGRPKKKPRRKPFRVRRPRT